MKKIPKVFGPGTWVAAAFIGPGTLTTCTLAGVHASYSLLWVVIFSVISTIILQEMSARLGFVTGHGLGEVINSQFALGIKRILAFFLVISAIMIGNAAYEAGNIMGATLGLELLEPNFKHWPLMIGLICFLLMFFGQHKTIEKVLVLIVLLMSLCFGITAILISPSITEILIGLIPSYPGDDHLLLSAALVGTTVVPYNLFLHASSVAKNESSMSLREIRTDNIVSVTLGGLVTLFIIIVAASAPNVGEVRSAAQLALQLEPFLGAGARWFMGIGLVCAGLTSAITAPLASAWAAQGLFGWSKKDSRVKWVWITVLVVGVIVSMTGFNSILIIQFAQVTNAILLPLVAIYLFSLCNSVKVLGKHRNNKVINSMALAVILITLLISFKSLNGIFGFV